MKFLCLVHFETGAFDGMTPEQHRQLDDATIAHDHRLRASGNLLIASPLAEPETAISIGRQRLAKLSQTDGPYAETKEWVGGFLLLEAENMAAVLALLEDDPIKEYGRVEIRPLMQDHRHSETGHARPDFRAI